MQDAARCILLGDASIDAANALESALLLDRHDDEEDLLEVLALYAPSAGHPYADEKQLRAAIESFLVVEEPRG